MLRVRPCHLLEGFEEVNQWSLCKLGRDPTRLNVPVWSQQIVDASGVLQLG